MNRQVNPLDQTFVVDLLLDYMDSPSLLSCRLVNRTWYRQASARLKRAGWRIHLCYDRAEKYLRLLQITDRDTDDKQSYLSLASYNQKDRLQLCMHVLASRMETRLAAEIGTHYLAPLINGLDLELSNSRRQLTELASSLHWLLDSSSPSLQNINLRIETDDDFESNWIGSVFGLEQVPKLPALKTICIEHKDQTVGMVAATLQELVAKAGPKLDQIHVNSIEDGNPSNENEILALPPVLCGIVGSHLISNLVELDINVRGDNLGQYAGRLLLDRLVKLRTTGPELTGLTRFIRVCCPTLHSLEIQDPDESQVEPAIPHHEFAGHAATHFGHYVRQHTTYSMGTLAFMETFPNLTCISTNFYALAAMVTNGRFRFVDSKWNHVGRLHVQVPKKSASHLIHLIHLQQNVHVPRLHDICDMINQIYPNLHHLVISLGMEVVSELRHSHYAKLAYALGLALGMRSVKHVTIENMHDMWYLNGIMQEDFPRPIELGLQQRDISNLESLTLRGISKLDCRRRELGNSNRPGPECLRTVDFNLTRFLTLLPPQCPNLLVRVERELVCRDRRENPNMEQIQNMTNPKVEFI